MGTDENSVNKQHHSLVTSSHVSATAGAGSELSANSRCEMTCITLLTDFGTQDAYVAQMKGQILGIYPEASLVDITHAVPPQDIEAGALLLAQAVPFFPAGSVHVAIVDPGVGTARPMIGVEVMTRTQGSGASQLQRVVLPDNGLISMLLQQHELVGANYLTNQVFWRSAVSHTFHGRDIMGPAAAHWARGAPRASFGPVCLAPVTFSPPSLEYRGNSLLGKVIWLDHYGNVITNIPGESLAQTAAENSLVTVELEVGQRLELPLVATYGQSAAGQLIVLIGSHGYLELARVGGNAAEHLGLRRQAALRLTFD